MSAQQDAIFVTEDADNVCGLEDCGLAVGVSSKYRCNFTKGCVVASMQHVVSLVCVCTQSHERTHGEIHSSVLLASG